jgi:hypothetical protein
MEAGFDAHKRQDVRLYYGARNLGRMAYQVHAESCTQDICNEYSSSYGTRFKIAFDIMILGVTVIKWLSDF